jgi:hypothetical protein
MVFIVEKLERWRLQKDSRISEVGYWNVFFLGGFDDVCDPAGIQGSIPSHLVPGRVKAQKIRS